MPKKATKTTIITSIDKTNDATIFTYDVHTSVITQYVLPGCAKPGVEAGPGFGPPGFGPGFGLGLGVVSGSPCPRK